MGLAARVKLFDAYHKPERHLTKKTAAGGAVTLSSLLLMAFVFVFELRSYLATERVTTTGVDVTRDEMLAINVDVTFTSLPCQTLSLDALDASGKHDQDVGGELHKTRVDRFGRAIATYESHRENDDGVVNLITELFYGFETEGHKAHVDEIKTALSAGEGCRVHGRLKVQRVAGNFHVSVHGEVRRRDGVARDVVHSRAASLEDVGSSGSATFTPRLSTFPFNARSRDESDARLTEPTRPARAPSIRASFRTRGRFALRLNIRET